MQLGQMPPFPGMMPPQMMMGQQQMGGFGG
jgi:hypothetical protein